VAPGVTHDAYFARIPMRRWAEIGEVAEAAVFLSSASAAYITGAIIDVDGGSQLGDASTGLNGSATADAATSGSSVRTARRGRG
jgi:hypothetical protein